MKKILLFVTLLTTSLGFSQVFDNIPTGSGNYINKLIVSPSGSDLTNEYIEVRGTPNAVIPTDLYLISIEGDGNSSSLGQVEEAIQLGDGVRTFGSNGILAIVCNYTSTVDATVTTNGYSALMSPDATVIVIELTGNDVTGSSSSNVSSQTPDIGYDGNFIDASGTYMLVSASANPKDVYIDGPSAGDGLAADGNIDTSGDHTLWTLYDSVAYIDDNDEGSNEYGYAQVVYAQQNGINSAVQFITSSATVVNFDSTSDANYMLRQGTKTGYTENDWIVAGNGGAAGPNWEFSTTVEKVYPSVFVGWADLNLYYGELNPTAESLSVYDFSASNFKIYPNPAKNFLTIESNNTIVNSVEMFDVLGKKVLSQNGMIDNKLDISALTNGIYILKLNAVGQSVTRKIIKE